MIRSLRAVTLRSALRRLLPLAAAGLLLSACNQRTGPLAPLDTYSGVAKPTAPGALVGGISAANGDSVYTIAKRYNVPVRELIDLNHLTPPYKLGNGQRLVLPTPREYAVQKGDSLYGISRMFHVDSTELARLNGMQAPYAVKAGQKLRMPGSGGTQTAGLPSSGEAPAAAPSSRVEKVELAPPSGAVAAPPAAKPSGMTLTIVPRPPGSAVPAGTAAAPAGTLGTLPASPSRPALGAATPPPVKPSPSTPAATPVPLTPAAPAVVAAVPPPATEPADKPGRRSGGRLLWPLKGTILSEFGPKPDGMHNDGINIAASKGTSVIAAENGVVAYAGNELRGFGNLLLVRHADGWITAYAHLDQMLVERGAKVKRGQNIGTVGGTGSVNAPQLHFEVRKGSQAVDPREHLEANQRASAAPGGAG